MADIYLSNLSGQFDYQQILDKYQQLKFQQATILLEKEDKVKQQKSAFATFSNMLENFQSAFESFGDEALFDKKSLFVSDESVASVSIGDATKVYPTQLDFTVTQLAKKDVWLSQSGVADREDTVASADGTLTLSVGGEDYAIDYSSDDTIDDIASKINQSGANVNATIFFDGNSYRLLISSKETGTNNTISFSDSGDLLDNLELGDNYSDSHVQSAQNAKIDIYGEVVESQNNTFTNLIDGVNIEVKQTGSTTITVTNDDAAVKNAIEELFVQYNNLVDYTKQVTAKDGALSGDLTLQSVRSTIFRDFTPLMEKGLITVDHTNGHLSLNSTKFNELITSDKEALKEAFAQTTESLKPYMDFLFEPIDGLIKQKEKNYDNKIERYEQEITSTVERINREVENLKRQFIHLDSVLAQLNGMKTQIAAILPKENQEQ